MVGTSNTNDYTTGSSYNQIVWTTWTSCNAITTNDTIWRGWATSGVTSGTNVTALRYTDYQAPKPASRGSILSIYEYKSKISKRRARQQGLDLLHYLLSPSDWEQLRRYDSIRFRGSLGKLYEAGLRHVETMYEIDEEGNPIRRLGVCQTGTGYVPEDRLGALILAFRTDEAAALRRAIDHSSLLNDLERRRVRTRRQFRDVEVRPHVDGRKRKRAS